MRFLKRPFVYGLIFSLLLTGFSSYVLLDTFVIPHSVTTVSAAESNSGGTSDSGSGGSSLTGKTTDATSTGEAASGKESRTSVSSEESTDNNGQNTEAVQTETSYEDDNISINLDTIEAYDTTIYIADVQVSSAEYLKTAFAQDTYGTNITETTSSQAEAKNAILAVNGDYYGANKSGYVIKNGQIYRDTVRSDTEYDDLAIYSDGSFAIVNESDITAEELLDEGVTQLFAFGPALVENGEISVSENDEVGKAMASNPRTAIGIIDDLHYLIVVADGRSSASEGLSF